MGIYTKQRQKQKRHIVEVANDGTRQTNSNTKKQVLIITQANYHY